MGLKDTLRRIVGKERAPQRGARGQRAAVRERLDPTVQIHSPIAGSPPPPASPPASHPAPVQPPAAAPPAAPIPAPGQTPTPVASPPPAAPAQPAAQTAPPQPAAAGSGAATQYMTIPGFQKSAVTGVLVAISGDLEGEVYRVCDGENKLGRSEQCEVTLPDLQISREHANIVHQEGVFAILPLSDKNPTFVNEEPVDGTELNDGDVVRLGPKTSLRFRTIQGL